MANTVEIVIKVDNAQAVPAVKQTVASFGELPAVIAANTTALTALTAKLDAAGGAMNRAGNAANKLNGHMSSSLDGVRLLSQEFGLRLPRALESMISRMPAVTTAISGLMGAFAGVAIAEVFVRAGEAVYSLYNKYISLNAAAEEYAATVQKHRDEDFVNPHSIETATSRINEATAAASNFKALGEQIHNGAWSDIFAGFSDPSRFAQGIAGLVSGRKVTDLGYKSQGQSDALNPKILSAQHELTMMQIESAHAADSELRGQAKINAELQKRLDLNKENRRYTQAQDALIQGVGNRHAGETKQGIEDATARAEAAAQQTALQREITNKTIELQNQALNAKLQGGALYLAQELQQEAEIRRTGIGTQAEIDAVRARYHNEQMKRIDEENDAIAKRARAEEEAGMSTFAKLQAQGQDRLSDINERERKGLYSDQTAPGQPSAQAAKDRVTAQKAADRELAESQKQFDQEQQASIDRNDDAMMGGFAKIEANLQKSLQKRADEYSKYYGDLDQQDAVHAAARAQLAAANDSDVQAAARERSQMEQQISEQTLERDKAASAAERKGRSEGLLAWGAEYRQTVASIEAEHAAMIQKINDEENKPGVTDAAKSQYERQKLDADRVANAQIEDANKELAHNISGILQDAFDNPVKFIQNRMKQMMFEIVADWLAQTSFFKGAFGQAITGGGQQGGGKGGILGGLTGAIAGGKGATGGFGVGSSTSNALPSSSPGARPFGGDGSTGSASSGGYSTASSGTATASNVGSLASTVGSTADLLQGFTGGAVPQDTTGFTKVDNGDGSEPTFNADQADQIGGSGLASGADALGGLVGAGIGAYSGAKGVISAFEGGKGSDVFSGALSGAGFGASIGSLAGPIGAGIGAAIGAAGGAAAGLVGWVSGEGGRIGAEKYFKTQMRPQMYAVEQAYSQGGGGTVNDAISQVESIAQSGFSSMVKQFGQSDAVYVRGAYIDKERKAVEDQIQSMSKGGHDYGAASAVQFHTGGTIMGFGDLATSATEGFIHTMIGEKVTNPAASATHGQYIDAMNSGASEAEIAAMYLKGSAVGSGGGDTHIHHYGGATINALDSASFESYLRKGGINSIAKVQNERNADYNGESY